MTTIYSHEKQGTRRLFLCARAIGALRPIRPRVGLYSLTVAYGLLPFPMLPDGRIRERFQAYAKRRNTLIRERNGGFFCVTSL